MKIPGQIVSMGIDETTGTDVYEVSTQAICSCL